MHVPDLEEFIGQKKILEFLYSIYRPASVADIGCGYGLWVMASHYLGVENVTGFDDLDSPSADLANPPAWFKKVDMSKPFRTGDRYGLVISTEVAEHIDASAAGIFVDNLCSAADVVLFSAALPYQGGIDHVNENWVEYWHQLFSRNRFRCFDIFRSRFWNERRIAYFYRQNLLLFVHERMTSVLNDQGFFETLRPRTTIHPELLINNVHNRNTPEGMANNLAMKDAYYECVSKSSSSSQMNASTEGENEVAALRSAVKGLNQQLLDIRNSKSWKITAPIRWGAGLLIRKFPS